MRLLIDLISGGKSPALKTFDAPPVQGRRRRAAKAESPPLAGDFLGAEADAARSLGLEARLEVAGQPAAVFVEGGLAGGEEGVATAALPPVRPGTQHLPAMASAKVPAPGPLLRPFWRYCRWQ